MARKSHQRFVLSADNRLYAVRIVTNAAPAEQEAGSSCASSFGYIIAANSIDACDPTDYLELTSRQTQATAAWDDEFLYFTLRCDEPHLQQAQAYRPPAFEYEHDFRAREDVQVHLDVSPPGDEIICLSIGIDGRLAHRRTKPADQWQNTVYDQSFNLRWDARVSEDPDGWRAQVRIPFAELCIEPQVDRELGVNFIRNAFVSPEFTTWKAPGYWMVDPQTMGRLILSSPGTARQRTPTVILDCSDNNCTLSTDPAGDLEATVNNVKLKDAGTRFQLTPFQPNTFTICVNGTTFERAIPVESDTLLRNYPECPEVPLPDLLAAFAAMAEAAEQRHCGDGVYRHGDHPAPEGLRSGIHRPDLQVSEAAYDQPALIATALLAVRGNFDKPDWMSQARTCLDRLATEQRADGSMPVWLPGDPFAEASPRVEMHSRDCFYMNGLVGRAMLDGYEAFADDRYLEAAARIGDFNGRQPPSHNANYNAFCLIFQPELSRITGTPRYLHDAIAKYDGGIRPGHLLNGEWTGHNRHTNYMGIIGWGLGELGKELPPRSARKAEVKRHSTRMMNCLLQRLEPSAGIAQHLERGPHAGAWVSQSLMTAIACTQAFDLPVDDLMRTLAGWIAVNGNSECLWAHAYNFAALASYIRQRAQQ